MAESPYSISAVLSVGYANASAASWTSATPLNTAVVLVSNDYSYNTINVSINQTSTITGGVVTFQGSYDGTTYFNMVGFVPGTFAPIGPTYTLTANTYLSVGFNLTAIPYFQVLLSTAITGTATVTVGYAADSFVNTVAAAQAGTWTVAVTQSTSPWVDNVTQWASTSLGVPQTFGTAPIGVVIGTSSDLYVAGTRARSNQTTTAAGVVDVNNVGIDGTTLVTAAAGVQRVGIAGNANATLDSTVVAGTAPTNALATSGVYNTTQPAPTNGQAVAIQQDQAANALSFPGLQFKTGTAWSSATTINTLQFQTGTATQGALSGAAAVVVQLDQTTTLTGGAVTFQGTYDNINWVTIPTTQVLNPQTFAPLTNPYTFVANTNQPFLINLNGFSSIRANLTTLITGTGTVTPFWATLAAVTVQPIQVSANSGTLTVAVVPSSNTFFRFGNVTTASSSTNAKVESTTYTEQSTAVQRSISSSSANDTSAGTGARTVMITYYDASGNGPFTETDTLNGTTAVNTTATNICFIEMIQVLTVGSTGSNVGTITLFAATAGGGGAIGTIAATTNRTFWAHHYVPLGKTFHLTGVNVGSNSTTGGNGGNFTLFAQTLPVANQVNNQISDNLLLYGQSSNTTRTYNSPIAVAGPARVTMYVLPLPNATVTYYGSFDFFEQ